MLINKDFKDYECIDAGNGEKIERFGKIILRRPDPQVMWNSNLNEYKNLDGFYHRSDKGGGYWEYFTKFPPYFTINYKDLTFKVGPTNFKHMGIFPEQSVNWDYMINKISKANRKIKVLNLFAYTGCATMACSKAGADVVHVDASKGMIEWAKENMKLSHLENNSIRFICDDCLKFVQREYRRGNKYDAIIMDPPSYGKGPNGEVWKFEDSLYILIEACNKILSDKPLFFLINSYTTGVSSTVLANILKTTIKLDGKISCGEVGIPITKRDLILPCGIFGRWEEND